MPADTLNDRSLGEQSLSDLLYSNSSDHVQRRSTFRGLTVNCFPFDVIVFAMLPAHGIWRKTVSLLDVM